MSNTLFLARFDQVRIGRIVEVIRNEARHAVVVKHTRPGESMLLADGAGRATHGYVIATKKDRLTLEMTETLTLHPRAHWSVVAQALTRGDRSELAVEIMTELGVDKILVWQASCSIVRWQGERGTKSLGRWAATTREATKQSRRFRIPEISAADTSRVVERIGAAELALVLHESTEKTLSRVNLPDAGKILLIVSLEGSISPGELERFQQVGAVPVRIGGGILRTSAVGAIAIRRLTILGER